MRAMTRYRESVRSLLTERILDAAYELAAAGGWDRVRMTHIATTAGVSRQTVYTEFGNKTAIGESLLMREVERFLLGIQQQLLDHPDDFRAAIAAAVEFTLRNAAENPLLKGVLTTARGGGEDLLPLLTSRSEPLIDTATTMLTEHIAQVWPAIDPESRALAIETLVRVTVSHIVQPTTPPDQTAQRVAEAITRIARG